MELEKLKRIIAEVMNIEVESITEDTSFVDDLGADSLDIFQIIMGMEEEYDIEIDSDTVDGILTVRGAVEAIRRITGKTGFMD
ncbi:acyl carrier protein [Blautia sp. HCP3S3_G3]|uniref:acyl carrier protein n=1 Tax=Blautia sp. HCP3S3_G3 TaxID=3438913 RepID=UPI003F8C657F